MNPLFAIDFYKADHRRQYPSNTTMVYSNFTPRSNRLASSLYGEKVVFFGLQAFIKEFLIDNFNTLFFNKPKQEVVLEYKQLMDSSLGENSIETAHIEALHDLGYLPIEIRALEEGSKVKMGVPCLTIYNTHPDFFWLPNYLETIISASLWKPCTAATIAYAYKRYLMHFAKLTGASLDFVDFQAHDFSFRGMDCLQGASVTGAGHLTSFLGTDSVPSIKFLEKYYNATGLVGCSVPATEHSVMCAGSQEGEIETFKRLICDIYPNGIVSIVSDTWDYWKVLTEYLPTLKQDILARNGKVVIRPDSGDPVKIICGDKDAPEGTPENKGSVQVLWELFGGATNSDGFKELDSHIGLIYGDSITIERMYIILNTLKDNGFASSNIVFGIGSYTYQYVTRDTFGFAMKATYIEQNGVGKVISKNPKTDNGTKKSASGLLQVINGELMQNCQSMDSEFNQLHIVFKNGKLLKETTLQKIKERVNNVK